MTQSQEKGGVDSHFLNDEAHMGEGRASPTRGSWEKGGGGPVSTVLGLF